MHSRPNKGAACARFTAAEVVAIRDARRRGEPTYRIAKRLGAAKQSISQIIYGRTYAWVPGALTREEAQELRA